MGLGNKQFVVLCINSKTSDICFFSLVQQTVFSNFVLTFSIKDTFHFFLTQLLMLPIFINSLSKRKKANIPKSLMPQGCATLGLSGGSRKGSVRSDALPRLAHSLIHQMRGCRSLVPSLHESGNNGNNPLKQFC